MTPSLRPTSVTAPASSPSSTNFCIRGLIAGSLSGACAKARAGSRRNGVSKTARRESMVNSGFWRAGGRESPEPQRYALRSAASTIDRVWCEPVQVHVLAGRGGSELDEPEGIGDPLDPGAADG